MLETNIHAVEHCLLCGKYHVTVKVHDSITSSEASQEEVMARVLQGFRLSEVGMCVQCLFINTGQHRFVAGRSFVDDVAGE